MSNSVPFFYLFMIFKLSAVAAYMLSDLGQYKINIEAI